MWEHRVFGRAKGIEELERRGAIETVEIKNPRLTPPCTEVPSFPHGNFGCGRLHEGR